MVKQLSVALVHDWLDIPGGSERVLEEIARITDPECIFSLWHDGAPGDFGDAPVLVSRWAQNSRFRGKRAAILPLMPWFWHTMPAATFDRVVVDTHCFAHMARIGGTAAENYRYYVHSPARYVWEPAIDGRGGGRAMALPRAVLKRVDRHFARHHTNVAANSEAVRERLRRTWGVDAMVIHPPVDTDYFTPGEYSGEAYEPDFLLSAGRWVSYKRHDLAIELAEEHGIPLVIAGSGPEEKALRARAARAKVPVHFEVRPSRERLRDLYRGALALVFPAIEDFGIIPVEAQAVGCPVVAPPEGGTAETVIDGVSGVHARLDNPSGRARAFNGLPADRELIRSSALRFSPGVFRERMTTFVIDGSSDR